MRALSLIFIGAVGGLLLHMSPAVAQNFEDRWSIIPKAHADPAPPAPENAPATQEPKAPISPDDSHAEAPAPNATAVGSGGQSNSRSTKRVFFGKASFYSYRRAKTASGSRYDRDQFTAAHRSLPLGTKVKVTDLATNKSVVVRINDRGPFIRNRVLDLSLGAARSLGIRDRGVAEIRAETL
jgi:peptidoglycan lytic transglycosylase